MRYDASLIASGVDVFRGGQPILKNISIALAAGDIILLRGSNGIGKTTLLRTLAGFIKPAAGTVSVARKNIEIDMNMIAFCGSINAIKKTMTVEENLQFWIKLYGTNRSLAERAKEKLNLDAFTDYQAGALSTGYTRRLGLARLIIADRPIWLIDEPTASLDAAAAKEFVSLLVAHREEGGCALIATHDSISLAGARSIQISRSVATQ